MKRNVPPAAAVAVIVTVLCVMIGVWMWQPWVTKPLNNPPPTREERLKFSEEMKASMMQAHQRQR